MTGKSTMYGRSEGPSIYNFVNIAEAELVEGTERPVFAVKVTGCEVGEMGQFTGKLKKREKIARAIEQPKDEKVTIKKKKKAKGAKTLLSFGADEGEDGEGEESLAALKTKKPKFNTKLVSAGETLDMEPQTAPTTEKQPKKRRRSPSPPPKQPADDRRTRPKTPDPYAQVPPKDPEEPERYPSETPPPAARPSILERTEAEIASLKASMRRNVTTQADPGRKKSALEAMIPETSIRGRKRPPPGSSGISGRGGISGEGYSTGADAEALKLFNAFKAKLESSDAQSHTKSKSKAPAEASRDNVKPSDDAVEDEEAETCDLHFIVNCQSCKQWAENPEGDNIDSHDQQDDNAEDWMSHRLQFGKDMLGKDLNWKKEHRDDLDSLMVIDPREKEKEYVHRGGGKSRKSGRDREREQKRDRAVERELDRR
jgi:peptidyl-prolyl cis-trans isomerase SDCCAG10